MCNVVMGPYATQILAQYGADVVKVEPPEGDDARRTGALHEPNMASLFLGVNRGKRSVVLDLKSPHARSHLESLVRDADVLVHNIRPQKLNALGIDPESVMRTNPRIVYAMLTGFGQSGPYGGRPAYDDVIQGMSGLAELGARHCGGLPRYMPTIAADKTVGILAASAILAALMKQQREGVGSVVEVPMFESMVGFNLVEHFYGQHFEPPRSAPGYPRVLAPWRRPYRTADGLVAMMPYTDVHWQRFFAEVGAPQHAGDPRFADIAARTAHIAELLELASGYVVRQTTAHWLAACERLEIPAAPVARLDGLRSDEHLAATGFFEEVQDPAMGTVRFPGVGVRFDGRRPPVAMPPRLGEHTRALLAEAGLDAPQIQALLDQGAAIAPQPKN